ncbi:hypothetical protein ACIQBJ_03045 [Kitasatospora sp. NPDC088391]|uniref:hypothetical protein n=1 Tax=Kitasatospora sp. NPDC088391 TaxID=3364074 RepID=UPI0038217F08
MTDDGEVAGGAGGAALRRVLAEAGGPELLEVLAERLSGADLTTLLLEVFRRRADRVTPAEVMRRYAADRFTAPAPTAFADLRRVEDVLLAALPDGFRTVLPAPLVPLAAHAAVAPVDPRKVVATVRGTEVAADPTNALALEAARLRAAAPRSAEPVRLAASQRVVRAQRFADPGALAHFQLFALVSAGRDTGARSFERTGLTEHLAFAARALAAAGVPRTEVRLTVLDPALAETAAHAARALADLPGVTVRDDPDRPTGRGYYTGLCFKVHGVLDGGPVELGDGGFTDWTRRLTGSRKERLLISGYGLDRLAGLSGRTG